jgi:hypothetical protein
MPYRVSCPSRPRSPVIRVVNPWSFSHRSRRLNSARTTASLSRAPNSTSMVSSTTRRAPTACTAADSRMNRPSRSNSPVVTNSVASTRHASTTRCPPASSPARSKPSEATSSANSSADSSNASNTPGSSKSCAPRTRNSSPNNVLPAPGPPVTRLARPRGNPPPVISSNPRMPVGAFPSPELTAGRVPGAWIDGAIGPPTWSTQASGGHRPAKGLGVEDR